ncbi:MAG: hypothetical protein ACKO27_10730 [Ilumatobacteraceae bacterium]
MNLTALPKGLSMITSRRLALVTAVMSLGLLATGCGDDPGSTSAALPKISLAAGGTGTAELAASDGTSKMSMAYWGDITYVYDGTLPDLGTSAAAYRFPAGVTPDLDKVAEIAAALGVEGELAEQDADMGGGWLAGPADYSGPTLTVGRDGLLSWWYSNPVGWGTVGCVEGELAEQDADDSKRGELGCAVPEASANVPTADEAKAMAIELFESIGVSTESLEWDVYADGWSASATAFSLIDGMRSPLAWSVGYGAEGVLTWANGTLATAEEVGEYPIVSAAEGVERLNDDTRMWQWYGGGWASAARSGTEMAVVSEAVPAGSSTDASGTAVVTVGEGSIVGSTGSGSGGDMPATAVTVITGTIDAGSTPAVISPMPADEMPPPVTVTLTSVELGLTQVWDADGTVWMLPAFVFGSADSGDITVIAVAEDYLDIPEVPMPEPMPEPMPVESIPGELVDPMADAVSLDEVGPLLVGLTEAEAVDVATSLGVTLRVVRLDGEDLPATMDYSPTRVNVAVDGGVVTEAISVG